MWPTAHTSLDADLAITRWKPGNGMGDGANQKRILQMVVQRRVCKRRKCNRRETA